MECSPDWQLAAIIEVFPVSKSIGVAVPMSDVMTLTTWAPPRPSVDSVDSNMCRCVDTGAMMPHPTTDTTNIDWPLLWAVKRGVRGHTHTVH